jgi:putative addiction module antidote
VLQLERKIVKVGNSLGVIIPQKLLARLNVDHGDTVELDFEEITETITITKEKTPPLEALIESVVERYLKARGL